MSDKMMCVLTPGVVLHRTNGKSARIRKNPSSASLMHNQKLFNGDVLSFTQVTTITYAHSNFYLFLYQLVFHRISYQSHVRNSSPTFSPQASGQQIPIVVESCIRFINLNGEHS